MASTSSTSEPGIRALGWSDLPGALALSASAHWNQNEADWRTLLALGQGWGMDAVAPGGQRVLAASSVVVPYSADFAWVSMVLVRPEFRRQGWAGRLVRHSLQTLQQRGLTAVLDATPAGHAVYRKLGFVDTWSYARYQRLNLPEVVHEQPAAAAAAQTRPLLAADWPAIAALDAPVFGARRLPLLQALARRQPRCALVLQQGGHLVGYVLARDGREATQIGPLLAPDEGVAARLLADALAAVVGPVYVDLLDQRPALQAQLHGLGFVLQRPYTRMVQGRKNAPGDAGVVMLVAGPELG